MRTLVWFRGKDLRVADHAPLLDATRGGEVVPLFVVDPYFFAPERARTCAHRMQLLVDGIAALSANVAHLGSELVVVAGKSVEVIPALVCRWKIDRVVAHRWSEPFGRVRDDRIARAMTVPFDLYEGETLAPPDALTTQTGRPYSVFTPFARAFRARIQVEAPLAAPRSLPPLPSVCREIAEETARAPLPSLEALGIARNASLLAGGERAGRDRLRVFLRDRLATYDVARDAMGVEGTSRLSVDLKFGTVSARATWHAAESKRTAENARAVDRFHDELLWRDFAHATLWHRPDVLEAPFDPRFSGFPWRDAPADWIAWRDGRTGYPIVDAAARQLVAEGFVHNRARMISASFLTKHLLLDFRLGEAHYLAWLADGDWAANDLGWQWSAGCGCDAQPYFRVFHPVIQGRKFDADGRYVRRWLPELARLPTKWIHAPWEAPPLELRAAGVRLGSEYPSPIVDHAEARDRYLKVATAHLARR